MAHNRPTTECIPPAGRRAIVRFLEEWGSRVLAYGAFLLLTVLALIALHLFGVEITPLVLGGAAASALAQRP